MTDYFALLNEQRRPWIDPEMLKTRFLIISAEIHPDRVHLASPEERQAAQNRYAEVNAAYQCLREPRDRLRHLIELERGEKPNAIQRLPSDMMDWSVAIGQLCREVDRFLTQRANADSAMLKAQQFRDALDWTERLRGAQQNLAPALAGLADTLKNLNPVWESATALGPAERRAQLPLEQLENIYSQLSYLCRWHAQISERIVQLSF